MKNQSSSNPGEEETPHLAPWQEKLYEVIFLHHTPAGRAFDLILMMVIIASVLVVMLESVSGVRAQYASQLIAAEWVFTILFTIEYILRLVCVRSKLRYARSFFGIVDLLAVLPTYIGLFFASAHYLMIIRILRLLRIFRILKLARFLSEADVLISALKASRAKITVFLGSVVTLVVVMGTLLYIIEGEAHGYTSIPQSVYWAIVTITTVGYGDISPQTPLGRFVASILMIMGYGIIAVPTGIVSVELHEATRRRTPGIVCPQCGEKGHVAEARYCRMCGGKLVP